MTSEAAGYSDPERFEELKERGDKFLADGSIEALRGIIYSLSTLGKDDDGSGGEPDESSFFDAANIIKG
jgi:hypothetical protein